MENKEFLDNFEKTLQMGLMRVCSGAGLLGNELLSSEDIDSKWEEYIKDYVADAVDNFNEYPEAALAWAGFLGMGVAHNWDDNWTFHRHDSYRSYYGNRGWDDMDEHILHGILGLDLQGKEAKKKEKAKVEKDVQKFSKKLSNPGFLAKAAPEIIEKDRAKLADLSDKLERVKEQLAEIG